MTTLFKLMIDWDFDTVYTDESAYLLTAIGQRRIANPADSISAGRGIIDTCTLVLDNADDRFSSLNSGGALYSVLQSGGAYHAPMYLQVSMDSGSNYYTVFTGVIKYPQESPPTAREAGTVTLTARSMDEKLLNARLSTTVANFAAYYDNGETEASLITAWLTAAGVAGGAMDIDSGLMIIPWAWLDDESPIEDIWMLAAAAGGHFFTKRDGTYTYRNSQAWALQGSLATYDRGDYEAYRPQWLDSEMFSQVVVEYSPRAILDSTTVWESVEVYRVPPSTTKTVTAKLRQPVYSLSGATWTAITPGGLDITADVTVTLGTQNAQRVDLSIENANAVYAANMVILSLTGAPVSGLPRGEVTKESTNAFWASFDRGIREKAIRSNLYVQTLEQAAMLATFLRDRYELARLQHGLAGLEGVPTLELGDRITIDDDEAMGAATRDGYITGITFRCTNGGFLQDLVVIDRAQMYPYLDDATEYFVIGTNTLGTLSSNPGRIYY